MLNFVLCEDHQPTLDRMVKMLESIFISNNISAQIGFKSNNAEDILKYVGSNHADVLFLDISLKSTMSGLDLAKTIRKDNKLVYIIYISGHLEYLLLAYKTSTFDFLPKPFSQDKLKETVLRLLDDMNCNTRKKYIKVGANNVFINQEEINYIRRDGMKLILHTQKRQYEMYSSFNKLKDCLTENFVQAHKSFYVNVNNISNIKSSSNTILFGNNEECYIGPKYKNTFMEVINKNAITKDNLVNLDDRKYAIN